MNKKLNGKTTFTKKKVAYSLLGITVLFVIFLCVNVLREVVYGVFGYAIYAYLPALVVSAIFLLLGKRINVQPKRAVIYIALFVMVVVTLHVGLSKSIIEGSSYFASTYSSNTVGGVLIGVIAALFRLICAESYGITFAVTFALTAALGLIALYPLLLELGGKEKKKTKNPITNAPRVPQVNNLHRNASGDYVDDATSSVYVSEYDEFERQKQNGIVNASGMNNDFFKSLTSEEDRQVARANQSASILFNSQDNNENTQTINTPRTKINSANYSTLNILGNESGVENYMSEQDRLRNAQEALMPSSAQEEYNKRFGNTQPAPRYYDGINYFSGPQDTNGVRPPVEMFEESSLNVPVQPVQPEIQPTHVFTDRSQVLDYINRPISGEELLNRDFNTPQRSQNNNNIEYMYGGSNASNPSPQTVVPQETVVSQPTPIEPIITQPIQPVAVVPQDTFVEPQPIVPQITTPTQPIVSQQPIVTQPVVATPYTPVAPQTVVPQTSTQPTQPIRPIQEKFNIPQKQPKPVYVSNVMANEQAPVFPEEPKEKKPYIPKPYKVPSFDLLKSYSESTSDFPEDYLQVKQKLDQTMQEFDVPAEVFDAKRGPTFTMYYLNVGTGYKLSRFSSLKENLKMRLCVQNLRIHAPVPGQNALGIELPNSKRETVGLKSILCSAEFNKDSKGLKVAMGKTLEGTPYVADITKMPHLLVAGSTGTGKSVFLNALLTSLLFKYSPEDLRMVLIDPKKVELTVYKDLPNLLIKEPVKEAKHAVNALRWLCQEMDRRYEFFSNIGCANIDQYNEIYRNPTEPKMYRILLVIDEMADLMMNSKDSSVEDYIVRIAQLARACGIHMVIATQRPTVKVITGLIKSNIIHRVAFTVKTNMDSRVILDDGGAEELLGIGDMLYSNPSGLVRMQGAFIDIGEIKAVCDFIRQNNESIYDETIAAAVSYEPPKPETPEERMSAREEERDAEFEKLLQKILKSFIISGRASVSSAQTSHKVGYIKAKKLVDTMAERGFLSQGDGAKPRDILITLDEWEELFGENRPISSYNIADDEDSDD